ncbi:MAG TPA: hypothetical protein VI454_03365, partial [Verrucomicrobiae bacterium]
IGHFADRNPRNHIVAVNQTKTVYNTTIVNNTYITGNNNTVINKGISRDTVVKVSKTPITKVTIRDAGAQGAIGGANPDRIRRDSGREVIYKPVLAKANVERVTTELRQAHESRSVTRVPAKSQIPAASPTRAVKPASQNAAGPATVPTPSATVKSSPVPKPAISDQRLSRERANQLAEEAKAKARERQEAERQARSVPAQRPQENAPTVNTTPTSRAPEVRNNVTTTPRVETPRPQPQEARPPGQVRREEVIQRSPQVREYQHRGAQPSSPPQAVPQIRSEPAPRQAPPAQASGGSERGGGHERGNQSSDSKGSPSSKGKSKDN